MRKKPGINSIFRITIGEDTYYFQDKDFRDIGVNIMKLESDEEFEDAVVKIIGNKLGLTWSFLQ